VLLKISLNYKFKKKLTAIKKRAKLLNLNVNILNFKRISKNKTVELIKIKNRFKKYYETPYYFKFNKFLLKVKR
jgi:hypothetical protein